jgi:TonB family protein
LLASTAGFNNPVKGISQNKGTASRRDLVMAPLTKDIVEPLASLPSSADKKPSPSLKLPSHSRADAVSLEIPVKIHGSRSIAGRLGASSQPERFEEQTSTMIVFANGGVVRMSSVVALGQMVVLTNLRSRQDVICRVLHVRSFSKDQSYVEFEFNQPQPGYWGVHFPSEGSRAVQASAAKPQDKPEIETKVEPLAEASQPLVAAKPARLAPPVPALDVNKPQASPAAPRSTPTSPSAFASFGTKEQVQPFAAAPSLNLEQPDIAELEKAVTRESEPIRAPDPKPPETLVDEEQLIADVLESAAEPPRLGIKPDAPKAKSRSYSRAAFGSVETADAAKPDRARTPGSFGTRPGGATTATSMPTPVSFGTRLGADRTRSTPVATPQNRSGFIIALGVVVLLGAVGGGVWYFRSNLPRALATTASNDISQATASPAQQPAQPLPSAEIVPAEPSPSALAQPPLAAPPENRARKPHGDAVPSGGVEQHAIANRSAHAPAKTSNVEGTTAEDPASGSQQPANPPPAHVTAHPLFSQRSLDTAQVPTVDVPAGGKNNTAVLPAIAPSGVELPAPPDAPIRIAGTVKQPQVISAPMPVYPQMARQVHIEGDVVIDTQIDKAGNVVGMKVVSGPQSLRQAALDALRKWKYQPSLLDGQPVAVQMLITIKFRL